MDQPQLATDVPVRPAATVMLLRDGADGLEVFMMRRNLSAAFARGQYVFPGGRVDEADHAAELASICDGGGDAAASRRLGVESGGLGWLVAVIRECFEEAGVLLARPVDGEDVVRFDDAAVAARFAAARAAVHDGQLSLLDLCGREGLRLLTDRLHYVAHWLTPLGERRRFDTRFLLAAAPPSQTPLHDDGETIDSFWVRPAEALARRDAGELAMFPPTIACLRMLDAHATVAEAISAAQAIGNPPLIEPRLVVGEGGRILSIKLPDDDDYESTPIQQYVLAGAR